ncbi:hypothetical protein SCP_0501070 [Sparassis crispa]|uniref:Uncharacterized protein n=1 Tax=Sparassis crispa TaxID=139825 RepID=A0A401GLJ6_9APHY|nr:hypothetical protein SCP_0501070 [Sparassis crispa]GBE83061.1 hypothetical protein SCP_0501070 [Sparassis crispa]
MSPHLHGTYQQAFCSLEGASGSPELAKVFFDTLTYNRSVCCVPLTSSHKISEKLTLNETQVIFEVIGQIAAGENNFTLGDISGSVQSRSVASCWIECRPDFISHIQWRRIPDAIKAVAAAVPGPVDVSTMIRVDSETDTIKLKVQWNRASSVAIPMYDVAGKLMEVETADLHGRPRNKHVSVIAVPLNIPIVNFCPSPPSSMSVFEPESVLAQLRPYAKKKNFEKSWKTAPSRLVENHWKAWKRARSTQSQYAEQLEWEAHIVEYINFVYDETKLHGNSKKDTAPSLRGEIPLLGPRFIPSSYLHLQKRDPTPNIIPEVAYLKPVNVVHPFYYPELARCPQCDADDTEWSGWTATGHREVHGVSQEEMALGFQLRCTKCKQRVSESGDDEGMYCFSTTSHLFWGRHEHWEIPLTIPYCLWRCAVTRDLFDLIVELRPSMTAAGLAENIKQLHLLEYHRQHMMYLQAYKQRRNQPKSMVTPPPLCRFSNPARISITDDLVTDIYAKFSETTRQKESEDYLQTLAAVCISMDHTFRVAGKASVVDGKRNHLKMMKGGVLSVINENNEIISWCFCQTQTAGEMEELLMGLKRWLGILEVSDPDMAIVDNCCQSRSAIVKPFPNIHVGLDMTADKHNTAVYWNQSEQERRLEAAYQKWADHGGVWTAAATKVHLDQLSHVRKGCLTRPRQDIRADGSHIEGSHKGASSSPFLRATLGSHHIHLVNSIATFWNSLLTENKQASGTASNLRRIPELQIVASGETFGLVNTKSAANYHNLLELKNEPEEELYDLSAQAELNVEEMLQQIDVNPELLRQALASGSKTHLTATATGSKSQLSTWSDTSDLKQSDVACVCGATTYSLASMSDPSTSTAVVLATPISCTPPSDVIDVDSELHVQSARKQKAKWLTFNVESEEGSPSVPKNAPVPTVGSSSQAGKRKVVVDGPNEDKWAQSYSGRSLQDAHALEYISAGSKRVKLSVKGWKSASLAVHNPQVESGKMASPSGSGTSTSTNGVSAGIVDFFSSTRRTTAGAASSKILARQRLLRPAPD